MFKYVYMSDETLIRYKCIESMCRLHMCLDRKVFAEYIACAWCIHVWGMYAITGTLCVFLKDMF